MTIFFPLADSIINNIYSVFVGIIVEFIACSRLSPEGYDVIHDLLQVAVAHEVGVGGDVLVLAETVAELEGNAGARRSGGCRGWRGGRLDAGAEARRPSRRTLVYVDAGDFDGPVVEVDTPALTRQDGSQLLGGDLVPPRVEVEVEVDGQVRALLPARPFRDQSTI